jgi:hypothetical protein
MKIISFLKTCLFLSVLAFLCGFAFAEKNCETNTLPFYSKLVHPGEDGRLVYISDEDGGIVPDFSYAGYMGGGVRLPKLPVVAKVTASGENDAAKIQAVIDKVSAMPPDKNGFRGAILLKKGYYVLENPLKISAGGIVLRGEGQGEDGTVLFGKGNMGGMPYDELRAKANLVVFEGASGVQEITETTAKISDSYIPIGAKTFTVDSAKGFNAGDKVIVRRYTTKEWYAELKLDVSTQAVDKSSSYWTVYGAKKDSLAQAGRVPRTYDFERTVTQVDGNKITVDVSLTIPLDTKWGRAEIVKFNDDGRISQAGVENLSGISDFNKNIRTNEYGNMDRTPYYGAEYYSDENHYWNFVKFVNVTDSWVRDISGCHFAGSCVYLGDGCKHVTIQDCSSYEPVSLCQGGRRFVFQICGQMCLVQRCKSDKGRHSFVLGGDLTCGPNVFLDCTATRAYGSSEPHSTLVVGSLYDNVHAPLAFRFAKSNPVRWMSLYSYAWNCEGLFIVQKPPTAQHYSIGHIGIHAMIFNKDLINYDFPDGYIESLDTHVSPKSLYLKQLEDRLGIKAVKNIAQQ